jgi:ubiquinone/menaquinone biosynthesis C-methylase UbiE
MFSPSVPHYDRIYALKDYDAESRQVADLVRRHGRPGARTLLDVACGTGKHLAALKAHFEVEGSDLLPEMLAQAAQRLPGVRLTAGDFRSLNLGRRFDIVTCLFSSIGYALTEADLAAAWRTFARHLAPGGVAVVEPWFVPEAIDVGHVGLRVIDEPGFKLVRMNSMHLDGRLSSMDMHHLVGTPKGVKHFVEQHVLACWTPAEMESAARAAGLKPLFDAAGLPRGAWIGKAP